MFEKNFEAAVERFPWSGLIVLALSGFVCILTEAVPAGLLLPIGESLRVSEASAGQLVTAYALGSLLAAIPLTQATQGWRRKRLLLLCLAGFLVFNTVTALSPNYMLTLAVRFLAGVTAGVLWGVTAGYARLMAPVSVRGKAMAVAMSGTPLALAFGVPLGTFIGGFVGWRAVFGLMSLLALLLLLWALRSLPDFPGRTLERRMPLRQVFVLPGVRPVLLTVLAWILAHNILYTYIAPYLTLSGLDSRVDLLLLLFGAAALAGIIGTGASIDGKLRRLVMFSLAGFGIASLAFAFFSDHPFAICLAMAIWGLTFGGAATLLQTAVSDAGGENADLAQSMLVTSWNLAIAGGSVIGALLLNVLGAVFLPWANILFIAFALITVYQARVYGFPLNKR
ncbi:MFS transporter [Saccharibacillus deserti]|uniref:MFS transporter n=1 Tax=Saccharibacillus deserti TaxID=1634444 RepID=UPI001FE80B89|nr:MFS transporter [Saccharibacillus deserti]